MRIFSLFVAFFFLLLFISANAAAAPAGDCLVWTKDLGHGAVTMLSMTSDASFFSAATNDGTIVLLNRDGGAVWNYFNTKSNSRNAVAAIHPSGTNVLGASGTSVYLISDTGSQIWSDPRVTKSTIYDVAYSLNGYGYTTGGNTLEFFGKEGNKDFTIKTASAVWRFAISSDGTYFVTGTSGQDHRVYLYDRNQSLRWMYDPGTSVNDVDVAYGGSRVVAGAGPNVYFFSQNGALIGSYDCGSPLNGVSMSSDGTRVAVGMQNGGVKLVSWSGDVLWETQTGGHVYDVALSSDGTRIAVAVDSEVRFYSPNIPAMNPTPAGSIVTPTTPGTGAVAIASTPPSAGVYVDNAYKGITPITVIDLLPGEHAVIIRSTGYADWSTTVKVPADTTVTLSGSLSRLTPVTTRSPLSEFTVFGALSTIVIFTAGAFQRKRT